MSESGSADAPSQPASGFVCFHPHALYSLNQLKHMLHGIIELSTFLDRLGLRRHRLFRDAVWGWEILSAAQCAEDLLDDSPPQSLGGMSAYKPRANRTRNREPVRRLVPKDLSDA